jgi:hypothetical protein
MPSYNCYADDFKHSSNADSVVTWLSYLSFLAAVLVTGSMLITPAWRSFPKRTVTFLGLTSVIVEGAYALGSFYNFEYLSSGDDYSGTPGTVCLAQGCVFQFGVNALVLLFMWFQYAQYLMLCYRVPTATLRSREPFVLALIFAFCTIATVTPALTGHVGVRPDFYACWVQGPWYLAFYIEVAIAMLFANIWSCQTIRWLDKITTSRVGTDRPRALRSLARYRVANVSLLLAAAYIVGMVVWSNFFASESAAMCLVVSLDVVFLPLFFLVFVHGYACAEALGRSLRVLGILRADGAGPEVPEQLDADSAHVSVFSADPDDDDDEGTLSVQSYSQSFDAPLIAERDHDSGSKA